MRSKNVASLGFTLIELMVTIAIAAILLGVAIPSFTSVITRSSLTANTNEFVTALNLARSEAIKRGQHVVVRKTGTNWEDGWQVFVDINRSTGNENILNTGTDIQLRVYPALPANFTLRGNNNFVNFIRYQPNGTSHNVGTFAVCHNGQLAGAKLIIINAVGRTRMGNDDDNDGIPEKDDGTEITSCTTTSGF